MKRSLGFLGLAEKSGNLGIGEEACRSAVLSGKAKLILTASDSAANTVKKAKNLAEEGRIQYIRLPYSKDEIGTALGRGGTGLLVITSHEFAGGFAGKLAEEVPGVYDETAKLLTEKAANIRRSARRPAKKTGRKNRA